jgi:Lipopolysaccharide-assembly
LKPLPWKLRKALDTVIPRSAATPAALRSTEQRSGGSAFVYGLGEETADPPREKPARGMTVLLGTQARSFLRSIFLFSCLLLTACGYHSSTHAQVKLPSGINTIAVPIFVNKTNSYRAEQVLTEAVVREFTSRSEYRIETNDDGTPDAVLHGTVVTTNIYPLTYDSQTGRQSSAIVQISMSVKLVDKHGKTLFENPNYSFREQYQVTREVTSFFDESPPAVDRLSRDFARTLVAEILEGF